MENKMPEKEEKSDAYNAAKAKLDEMKKAKALAMHVVQPDEALSTLALKYYGHATPTYYNLIYEANKDQLGDSPNNSRPGMELVIPHLTDNLKDKYAF
jgi:nucleoid-associated protein YgaU